MSDYPWIDTEAATRPSRADLGWTIAECTRCLATSHENAEPYTEDWTHEHARKCHPRWSVRRGACDPCSDAHGVGHCTDGRLVWVIKDSRGVVFGCRSTHADALKLADHKARMFLRGELIASGWQP